MSKRIIEITIPVGEKYFIHDNGNIERGDGQNTPHDDWKMLGIRHVTRTTEFIPFANLANILGKSLCFANGNPQYSIVDMDHGFKRIWGNTKFRGIKTLNFIG